MLTKQKVVLMRGKYKLWLQTESLGLEGGFRGSEKEPGTERSSPSRNEEGCILHLLLRPEDLGFTTQQVKDTIS